MSQNLKNGKPLPCFSFSRQGGYEAHLTVHEARLTVHEARLMAYEAALRAMKRSIDRLHVFLQIPFLIIMSGANASYCGVKRKNSHFSFTHHTERKRSAS